MRLAIHLVLLSIHFQLLISWFPVLAQGPEVSYVEQGMKVDDMFIVQSCQQTMSIKQLLNKPNMLFMSFIFITSILYFKIIQIRWKHLFNNSVQIGSIKFRNFFSHCSMRNISLILNMMLYAKTKFQAQSIANWRHISHCYSSSCLRLKGNLILLLRIPTNVIVWTATASYFHPRCLKRAKNATIWVWELGRSHYFCATKQDLMKTCNY